MKLSVIVPVYNAEPYLRQCLDSLVNQTIDDYELILVNDGSTDSSLSIMEEYRTRYPDLIKSITVTNGGQGRARNFGLESAKGDYVGFVDSDDWVETDMFEKLFTAAQCEEADIAVCNLIKHFTDGTTRYLPAALQDEPLASAGSACNKLFRRSLIGGLRFPVGIWFEDFVFSAALLLSSRKTVFVHESLYCYRVGQQSTTTNNNSCKNYDIVPAIDRIKQYMTENGITDGLDFLILNHILLDTINRVASHDSPEKHETIKRLRKYVRENIPYLFRCESFKKESAGRRAVMFLNYHGLYGLSATLLRLKKSISD